MRSLSAVDILKIWEKGQNQHPLDKALTILAVSCPEISRDKLAALTIGQRDTCLLTLRERTFGSKLNGCAECPKCMEKLEFAMSTADICRKQELYESGCVFELTGEGLVLRFRLPNSSDLAAAVNYNDVAMARTLLIQRCVQQVIYNGTTISCSNLPEEIMERLAACMAECEPQSEVLLDLHCPECNHRWQILFDIVLFLWAEISSQAKRLMEEVHTLALAYGWSEIDILSMNPARRQFYLDMVV